MRTKAFLIMLAVALAGAFLYSEALAESKFRKSFRTSYEQDRFDAMGFLVKTNKDIIPGEVQSLVDEAKAAESFGERMALLDLANTMAAMYKEWHGEAKLLGEIEALQKEEIRKEDERKAVLEKWIRYESFPGNLVMRAREQELEAMGLAPVLFPHWVHRLNFECRACHPGVFPMKKTDSITMAGILEGRLCGECHNGKTAFDAADSCERCHIAGKPGEEALLSPKKADIAKLKAASDRLGTNLNLDVLPNKSLPFDRFGNIDWMLLKKAHNPIKSLKETAPAAAARDNEILFESPMPYVNNVPFSHKVHSEQIVCASCHQDIFKDELGSTTASMKQMAEGASCGACHGKVSFKFADCNRCHSRPVGGEAGGALLRKKQ